MTHTRALRLFPAVVFAGFIFTLAAQAQQAAAEPKTESAIPDYSAPTPDPASDMALQIQNVGPPPPDEIPNVDPIALYGNELIFDVYRKGSKIGEHHVTFARQGDELTVNSQLNLAVDVLFITAYRFEYESTEVWRKGQLVAVSVAVNDNGKIGKTNARMEDGLFKIDGPRGSFIGSSWVFPTNHWHRGQAITGTILNTLNGKLSRIEIVRHGIEAVKTAQGTVDAERMEYTGQLRDTEVWYDAQNRWVKMRFKAKDGSFIEYRCRQCGLTPGETQAMAKNDSAMAQDARVSPSAHGPTR